MTTKKKRDQFYRLKAVIDKACSRKVSTAEAILAAAERKSGGGQRPVAKRTVCYSDHLHDSKGEARRCNTLTVLERAGYITGLVQQPKYLLAESIVYFADWTYLENGREIVEDFKGFEYPKFKIIKRMWPKNGVGILRITGPKGVTQEVVSEQFTNKESQNDQSE